MTDSFSDIPRAAGDSGEVCVAGQRREDSSGGAPAQRRTVHDRTVALAREIARLHDAGAVYGDGSRQHVLVTTGRTGQGLVLSDGRLKRRRGLSRRARAADLARLFNDRRDLTTRTGRLRFLKHYLSAAHSGGTLRGWDAQVAGLAQRRTRLQYARSDRLISGRNRCFTRLALPNRWRARVVLASRCRPPGSRAAGLVFTPSDWRRVLSDPDALSEGQDVEVIKDCTSGLVVRRKLTVGGHELDVYVKRPRRTGPWKRLADCFRRSRPFRAFASGHEILARGIDTALPLAALERRVGPLLTDSILITETVPGPHLNQFLHLRLGPLTHAPLADLTEDQQHRLGQNALANLGRMVRRMHDNNIAHRDLKSGNILVYWRGETGPRIVLIDLDGLRRVRRISMRRRFQGLMRLNVSLLECVSVSHAGRLRMLLGYLRRPGSGRINFKPYWRVLERWSARKLRRQIRSRRKRQRSAGRPPR